MRCAQPKSRGWSRKLKDVSFGIRMVCMVVVAATVGIYPAMHYSAPPVFLAPAIYLFFHHLYTTWQMVQHGRKLTRGKEAGH